MSNLDINKLFRNMISEALEERKVLRIPKTSNEMPPMDMGGDPNAMGDPGAMGGDPSMMGGDPNAMGGDPSMMGGDPNAMDGGPDPMGEDPNAMGGEDEITSLINQLDDDDREAARKYIKSMIDRKNEEGGDAQGPDAEMGMDGQDPQMGPEAGMGEQAPQPPMMESIKITKKQALQLFENIDFNEFDNQETQRDRVVGKKEKPSIKPNSPFSSPLFK